MDFRMQVLNVSQHEPGRIVGHLTAKLNLDHFRCGHVFIMGSLDRLSRPCEQLPLILYPGESQAVIPVEIIGDTIPEANEFFFLDVFNPVGGSFGQDIIKLTAVRTIVDDDLV